MSPSACPKRAGVRLSRFYLPGMLKQKWGRIVFISSESGGVGKFVEDLAKGQGTEAATVEAEFFRTARPTSLLKRFAAPEEVAALVVYVCSPRASATNGAALRVDGGLLRSIV